MGCHAALVTLFCERMCASLGGRMCPRVCGQHHNERGILDEVFRIQISRYCSHHLTVSFTFTHRVYTRTYTYPQHTHFFLYFQSFFHQDVKP